MNIEIFKRPGSVAKLQKAMGLSSINISLTYLRGLQIEPLRQEEASIIELTIYDFDFHRI